MMTKALGRQKNDIYIVDAQPPNSFLVFFLETFLIIFPLLRDIEEKGAQSSIYRGFYSHFTDAWPIRFTIWLYLFLFRLIIDRNSGAGRSYREGTSR